MKDYKAITNELEVAIKHLKNEIPETIKGFSALGAAAKASGALDTKTKELIATAIAVAVRCEGCIGSHVKSAESNGATRQEVLEMLSMSVYMGGGPSLVYAVEALKAFDQFSEGQ